MEFLWPVMLWALLLVPLGVWAYLRVLRGRARAAARYADPHLFPGLARRAPAWRRHLPMALYLASMTLLVLASARPVAAIPLPVNRAAVSLVVDTSQSMMATDVQPSRLDAAKQAVRRFIDTVPGSTLVGLVSFSDYPVVLVQPTTDRAALREALDRLKPEQATAVGSAVVEAVRSLPERSGAGVPQPPGQPLPPGVPPATAEPPSELPPGAVIVFSDGVSNIGVGIAQAADVARRWKVAVYTIGLGTPNGGIVTRNGQMFLAPFQADGLQQIAQATGGRYFQGVDDRELERIYRTLGRVIGWERRRTEVTSVVTGGAGLVMLVGAALSLMWFRRVP